MVTYGEGEEGKAGEDSGLKLPPDLEKIGKLLDEAVFLIPKVLNILSRFLDAVSVAGGLNCFPGLIRDRLGRAAYASIC